MRGLRHSSLLLLFLLPPAAAFAQVGHAPERSPYRDITVGYTLTPEVVVVRGGGGQIGVAPHRGLLYGGRTELMANRAVSLGLEFAYGTAERVIIAPDSTVTGPVDQRFGLLGGTILLNLTGGKTWRNLAPYVGGASGIAFAPHLAADTSGYRYGARFYFAPTAGVRTFVTRNLYLRLEARLLFTRVRYPESYSSEVLPDVSLSEWVTTGLYTVGLGLPFPRIF